MRFRKPYLFAAVSVGVAALGASVAAASGAGAPSGAAAASAAAAAPAPAAAPASAAAPAPAAAQPSAGGEAAPMKGMEDDPPGPEKTPNPTLDEWKTAAKIKLTRADKRCNAYRVREWVKIHCSFPAAGAALMAGNPEGVAVWVDRTSMEIEQVAFKPRGVDIIFPVRRGDARYFELYEWFAEYMFPSAQFVSASLSAYWVDGEPAPVISM